MENGARHVHIKKA